MLSPLINLKHIVWIEEDDTWGRDEKRVTVGMIRSLVLFIQGHICNIKSHYFVKQMEDSSSDSEMKCDFYIYFCTDEGI